MKIMNRNFFCTVTHNECNSENKILNFLVKLLEIII